MLLNKSAILFRNSIEFGEELNICKLFFGDKVYESRMVLPHDALVVGRYSVMPFYKELCDDLAVINSKLINDYNQHLYIADIKNYEHDLRGLTPRTYYRMEDVPDNGGPFVLKGSTSSRKDRWASHAFAWNKKAAIEVQSRLLEDPMISEQGIVIRDYIPLVKLMDSVCGPPISKEFRFFVCYNKILSSGFYWSNYTGDLKEVPSPNEVPQSFLNKIINIIGDSCNFYVLDIAQTQSGEFILIEINDGQMSGLSECDPNELYKNLKTTMFYEKY